MASRVEGERVICYQCQNEWDRAHGGLTCPRCHSEFVEILDPNTQPEQDELHDLRDHNPWAPDPDEDDIEGVRFGGNNGNFSFTRTYTFGGPRTFTQGQDPAADQVMHDFHQMVNNLLGGRNSAFGGSININGRTTTFGGGSMPAGRSMGFHPFARDDNMFVSPFGGMFGPTNTGPMGPMGILNMLLDPANARSGDAVFSQEAMDRIVTQMMDAQQSNGAPPASQDLINQLPKKALDQTMAGDDGKAECSICMDNVDLGTEVATLPCNHWFHFECIESWLKEHDTCPHCRKPITPADQSQRRRSNRRSSSTGTPIPSDSPTAVRAAREQYFSRSRPEYDDRPSSERRPSRRSTGSQDGGGVGGWLRSRLPFSS